MPCIRHENVRHALFFSAPRVSTCKQQARKKEKGKMNDEDDALFDQQVKQWLGIYDRMFEDDDSKEKCQRKLDLLKKIREESRFHHKLLDLLIEVREKQLSQY